MSDEELVDCKICGVALRRDRRPQHIEWHAKVAARLHTVVQMQIEIASRPDA